MAGKYFKLLFIPITDESVINSVNSNCFTTCDPTSPGNNVLDQSMNDTSTDDSNFCCQTVDTNRGYSTDTTTCTLCKFSCIYYNYSLLIYVCILAT